MAFFSWEDVSVGTAHEYLSPIPRAHVKNPGLGDEDRGISGACGPASLASLTGEFQNSERTCLRKKEK